MIDRRKFLERSVMGAGSVFFSSMLLESCTKYGIPLPGGTPHPGGGTPIYPPPLLGLEINWNDLAKSAVTTGLEAIPEVGEILGPLADILWPKDKTDVWSQIKDQVEALVDQKIAAAVYQHVTEDLQGLNNSLILYANEAKEGSAAAILDQWITTKNLFVEALPHFQSAGNELPLLPLFGQYANLYLALLRDAVAFGQSWGRNDAEHQQDIADLQNAISDFSNYAVVTYQNGRADKLRNTKTNWHLCEPFKTVNQYDRQMWLTVLDFEQTWQYFDVTKYPDGHKMLLLRQIFSDPFGTCDDSQDIFSKLVAPPLWGPTHISLYDADHIHSIQLTYPPNSGPNGADLSKRMGAAGGFEHEFGIDPFTNPIVQVYSTYGDIVNQIQFMYSDGQMTDTFGGMSGSNKSGWIGYPDELLCYVHINGVSSAYECADCVVFAFQYNRSSTSTLSAIRDIYVKSPKEHSIADFAKAFRGLSIPANLITYELKAARQAYWADMHARAKEIK